MTPAEELTRRSVGPDEVLTSARRLRTGGVWAILGTAGIGFFSFLINTITVRLLPPEEVGAYFLIITLVSACALIGQMGLERAVVRLVAESMSSGNSERAVSVVVKALTWSGAGALTVAAVLHLGVGRWIALQVLKEPALQTQLWWISGWVFVLVMETMIANAFRGYHDIRLAVTFSGLTRNGILAAILVGAWALRSHADLSEVIIFTICAGTASTILGFALLLQKAGTFKLVGRFQSREFLPIAAPLLIHALLLYIVNQVNLWILGVYRPNEDVALYGAATRLVMLVGISTSVVNAVVPPLIAEKHTQGRIREIQHLLRSAATLCGAPVLLVLAAYIVWGNWFLGNVFGDFYRQAASVLIILSLAEIVNVLTGPCSISLIMTGHQFTMMILTILRALATVGGSIAVVGDYGVVGVAVVYAIALVAYNIISLLLARRLLEIWTHAGPTTVMHLLRR